MHVHLPKPLHGWREFAGEVGIIMVGVLLALTAEQAVEWWNVRHKVEQAEHNMLTEQRDDDLPQAYVRAAIGYCLRDQLRAVQALLEQPQPDRQRFSDLINTYRPPIRTWDTQAWAAAGDSELAAHMGAERRTQWAGMYNVMPRMQNLNWQEDAILADVQGVRRAKGNLSEQEADDLSRKVGTLLALNAVMTGNSLSLLASARDMGVQIPEDTQRKLDQTLRAALGRCVVKPAPGLGTQNGGALDSRLPNGDLVAQPVP